MNGAASESKTVKEGQSLSPLEATIEKYKAVKKKLSEQCLDFCILQAKMHQALEKYKALDAQLQRDEDRKQEVKGVAEKARNQQGQFMDLSEEFLGLEGEFKVVEFSGRRRTSSATRPWFKQMQHWVDVSVFWANEAEYLAEKSMRALSLKNKNKTDQRAFLAPIQKNKVLQDRMYAGIEEFSAMKAQFEVETSEFEATDEYRDKAYIQKIYSLAKEFGAKKRLFRTLGQEFKKVQEEFAAVEKSIGSADCMWSVMAKGQFDIARQSANEASAWEETAQNVLKCRCLAAGA